MLAMADPLANPYAYSGNKRQRQELPTADYLATPVAFTGAKPKPRVTLLPVIKPKPTNPPRVATVASDKAQAASAAAAGAELVPVPVVRRE